MKKIVSFLIVSAAVALVGCCGNNTKKAAEGQTATVGVSSYCGACPEQADECCKGEGECSQKAEGECCKAESACCKKAEGECCKGESQCCKAEGECCKK